MAALGAGLLLFLAAQATIAAFVYVEARSRGIVVPVELAGGTFAVGVAVAVAFDAVGFVLAAEAAAVLLYVAVQTGRARRAPG